MLHELNNVLSWTGLSAEEALTGVLDETLDPYGLNLPPELAAALDTISADIRERAQKQLKMFHSGIKRMLNPHQYPVGLEKKLFELKNLLIAKARGTDGTHL